ncbi:hypothetical protein [Pseudoramibacter porci]|uniref:Uncharacterized protein n=1 Tax=Pseudoramibacter porci TaxID=2606631 RepID=A0A7X2T9J1_9FIRM|nr:hypothetical protein [Pseudoramibacter porci]MSS18848.1 hypothetical protein [Pseudoramibacter porci]
MKSKPIRLSKKKNGKGYVTSYSVNIGTAEARECGLIPPNDDEPVELEKIIDSEHHRIIIQPKATD